MITGLTWLLKIELPSRDVLLSDGGVTVFGGDTYRPVDSELGSITSVDNIAEGIGQEIPALTVKLAPPGPVAITALSLGAIQKSRVRRWLAEYDTLTGAVVGTPELRFIGYVDQPSAFFQMRQFGVEFTAVPELEVMFYRDSGNGLSASRHKSLYPGEAGHDNATGLSIPVAWGTQSPPRGGTVFGGGGFGNPVLNAVSQAVQQ